MRKLPGLYKLHYPQSYPQLGQERQNWKEVILTKPPRWVSQGGSRPKVTMALATSVVKKEKSEIHCVMYEP